MGLLVQRFFPQSGINLPTCALIGMAAMFAGAARALLTSIVFALETTRQSHGLLPLLGACTASYFVSFFMMKGSIMTEKIRRRGISTPEAYEPDIMQAMRVADGVTFNFMTVSTEENAAQVKERFRAEGNPHHILLAEDAERRLAGTVRADELFTAKDETKMQQLLLPVSTWVYPESSMDLAVQLMDKHGAGYLPVMQKEHPSRIAGLLTAQHIFSAYRKRRNTAERYQQAISVKRRKNRLIVSGRKWLGNK